MADTDPGSLDRLHDIVIAPPVPWWPPPPGWYVVGSIVLAAVGLGVLLAIERFQRNRYRRVAIRELERILHDPAPLPLTEIAELTKRVALAAYPRDQVAALTGDAWLLFLDATGETRAFTEGVGQVLKDAAYRRDSSSGIADLKPLAEVIRHWIGHHRC
jgi:hypothetical protein